MAWEEGERGEGKASVIGRHAVSFRYLSYVMIGEEERNDVSGVCPKHLCSPYPKLSSVERAESGEAF